MQNIKRILMESRLVEEYIEPTATKRALDIAKSKGADPELIKFFNCSDEGVDCYFYPLGFDARMAFIDDSELDGEERSEMDRLIRITNPASAVKVSIDPDSITKLIGDISQGDLLYLRDKFLGMEDQHIDSKEHFAKYLDRVSPETADQLYNLFSDRYEEVNRALKKAVTRWLDILDRYPEGYQALLKVV